MDLRTGKTYDSPEAARADGVPASDIAHVEGELSTLAERFAEGNPIVTFGKKSPFQSLRSITRETAAVGAEKE